MEQLYLTGSRAGEMAVRLFNALNVRPVGCRIAPFDVDGAVRGDALHLLPPPAEPMFNGVPCRVLLAPERSAVVPSVLEDVAAPGLLAALTVHAPMLLDGLAGDLLEQPAFRSAVRQCLMGSRPVVVTAEDSAILALKALTPAENQLWFTVPEEPDAQTRLLETLITEAALRF